MNKQFGEILSATGIILHVPGVMAILSVIISLIFHEYNAIVGFGIVAVVSFIPGQILFRKFQARRLFLKESMAAAAIGWLLVSLVGAIPFIYWARTAGYTSDDTIIFSKFINAFFESVSGFTSTGLTMSEHPSELTHSLQWWRTFMQWIGGVGIIVFISALSQLNLKPLKTPAEDQKNSQELPTMKFNWNKIWWIYISATILSIGWLIIKNVPAWEAINHGMSAICTGGFTITENSLHSYNKNLFAGIIIIMVIGSLNFNSYREFLVKFNWKGLFLNREIVVFVILFAVGAGILFFTDFNENRADKIFQFASALGTCGFQTTDISAWPTAMLSVLIVAMQIGGTNGSTTGGLKIFRLIFLFKGAALFFRNIALPKYKKSYDKKWKDSKKLWIEILIFLLIWFVFYAVAAFILSGNISEEFTTAHALFETSSALSCVGLSTGISEAGLNLVAKTDLIVVMLIGRLELIPLIFFASLLIPRKTELLHAEDAPAEETNGE